METTKTKKELRRPDEKAMQRLLEKYINRMEEVIFRLAWQAGLGCLEILDLKWSEVSLEEGMIHLPRRSIPMVDELRRCLDSRRMLTSGNEKMKESEYVIVTDGYHKHPTKVHLSRRIAAAIDGEEELRGFRLEDLRNDFIIRILQNNPKTYAMEVAGINRVSINATFAAYLPDEEKKERNQRIYYEPIDEKKLETLIQAEGFSEVAITLQISWELGLTLLEIISLTWKQIDFARKELHIENEVYSISDTLIQILQKSFSNSIPSKDTRILLTPRSKKPFDESRLGKVMRNALIRGGLEDISLSRLSRISQKKVRIEKVYSHIKEHGYITKKQVADLWGESIINTGVSLQKMVAQGLLVQKGNTRGVKYYLPEE